MHSVMFIAYHFPPCSNVGGSIRSEKFIKYLPALGWDATILTLSESPHNVDEHYTLVEYIKSLTPLKKPYHIAPYGWLPPTYIRGRNLIAKNRYDLIYVSCPPFPSALVGAWLKKYSGIPLVIDFRDAWSIGPYIRKNLLNKILSRTLLIAFEKKVLREADWLIVNSPSALTGYLKHFPDLKDRISMIPNGYDEEDFTDYRPVRSNSQLKLLYTGSFNTAGRNPMPLLKAIHQIVKKQFPISLQIIGHCGTEIKNFIRELGLQNYVHLSGQVPHSEAIQAMARSDCLIIYQQKSNAAVTPVAGKTHEYLRSEKAILAILPPGDNQDIIRKYAVRCEVARPNDVLSIKQAIESLLRDWKNNGLTFALPSKEYLDNFNRKALTVRLVEIFNNLVDNTT